ncbi:MAG: hypothetical protein IJU62_06910 [Muribaculaceae bacterium]|nr:hypothetical protein [Muribaculaceae bacterium]
MKKRRQKKTANGLARILRTAKSDVRRAGQWLLLAAAIIAVGWGAWKVWRHYYPAVPAVDSAFTITGIDVSKHNGRVNMQRVAQAGHRFVFVKTSEGVTLKDAMRRTHAANARQAGLKVGAYHFFIFKRDGREQARNFLAAIKGIHLDMPLAIDVEKEGKMNRSYSAEATRNLRDMVNELRKAGHQRLLIYTNGDGYKAVYAGTYDRDDDMNLWLCSFQDMDKVAHRGHVIQQIDHHGRIKGVKGEVDLNVFCGDSKQWDEFLDKSKQ